jgi:hypothetical protein
MFIHRAAASLLVVTSLVACSGEETAAPTPDAARPPDDVAVDVAPDVAVDVSPDVTPDVVRDVPFAVAEHDPLIEIPNKGGAVMAHPQLVLITYADDPNRDALEAHARWLVASSWMHAVGDEYGVGEGSVVGTVRLTENAPDSIADRAVSSMLAAGIDDGRFPSAPGGVGETLYVVYFPSHTTITQGGGAEPVLRSCMGFGGYHFEAAAPMRGRFSYAVIPACPVPAAFASLTPLEVEEHATSHEVIEAATNPRPVTAPAWALPSDSRSPWLAIGPELADLCSLSLHLYREGEFVAERSWSNAAARLGDRDPCVPADRAAPYFNASISPATEITVDAGGTAEFTLRGWSNAPVAPWTLRSTSSGAFMPSVTFSAPTMNNGSTVTMRVTVPETARSLSYALIYAYVARSNREYRIIPAVVRVQ